MKLPTLGETFSTIRGVLNRFPLPVLIAFCGTVTGMIIVYCENMWRRYGYQSSMLEYYNHLADTYFFPILLTCIFILPLALAVDVFTESRKIKFFGRLLGRLLVVAGAIVPYFYFFKFFENWGDKDFVRLFVLVAMGLSFLSFAPFLFKGKMNGFWQYVMTLLTRFLEAFFYFAILFGGVALLLASVDYLFEITIQDEYYLYAWIFIVGILSMLFFFAGFPKDFLRLEKVQSYAKGYKVLTEYVLVPLVFAYLLVLYAYSAKILVTWEWPLGNVSSWIIAFSVAGIITYFLSYGSVDKALAYVKQFRKWLFFLFLPLIVVLFLAVWLRISDYGVTEPRYYIVLFGLWLLFLSAYFIFSSKKDIRVLPMSLFIVLLISIYGPLSSFEISKNSQLDRLEILLEENSMLQNGKIVKPSEKLHYEIENEIVSIVQYLVDTHGIDTLQPWFEENLNTLPETVKWNRVYDILSLMGLENSYGYTYSNGTGNFYYRSDSCVANSYNNCFISITGYDSYTTFDLYPSGMANVELNVGRGNLELSLRDKSLVINYDDKEFASHNFEDILEAQELSAYEIILPFEELTFEKENSDLALKVVINNLGVDYENHEMQQLNYMNGYLLLRRK